MYNAIQEKNNELKEYEHKTSVQNSNIEELIAKVNDLNKEVDKIHKQKITIHDEKEGLNRDLNNKINELNKKINEGKGVFQSLYSTSKLFSHKFVNALKNDPEFFGQKFSDSLPYFEENHIKPQEIDISESLKLYDQLISIILSEFEVRFTKIIKTISFL